MPRFTRWLLTLLMILTAQVLLALPASAALTLTSVSPPYALNTSNIALMVWGSGFTGSPGNYHATNPSITLRKAGQADRTVPGSSVYLYPAGDEIGLNSFPLSGAALGVWDVVVTNFGGETATLPGAFTVIGPYATPTVTGITPTSAPNTGPVNVTITGTNFFVPPAPGGPGMTATLTHGTPYGTIAGTNVVVVSSTQLTCTFDVTGKGWGAASPWNVTVQQPSSGPSATLNSAFSVTTAAPTVTSITPNYGVPTANTSVTIRGSFLGVSGYNSGNPSVTLRKAGQTDRTVAGSSVYMTNSTQISCTLPTSGAALGAWDVIVTQWDGQSATLPAGFTVYATAKPTVTGITPSSGDNNSTIAITNLAGTGFLAGATVKLTAAGQPDIPGTSVVVVSATKITCNFDLNGAVAGSRDVTVTIPDGQSGTRAGGFTIYNPAPTVTSITPNSGANNTTVNATIAGSGFMPGATVRLGSFNGTSVTVVSATEIAATFAIAMPVTGGGNTLDLVVTNPGGLPGTLTGAFTVIYPAPTITAVNPPYGLNTAVLAITVTGTGFHGSPGNYHASNPALTLRKAGEADRSVGGASIYMYPDGNQIGTNAFPLTGAAVGAWDVIVTNKDGQSATLPGGFTVLAAYATPTVTAITPNSAPNTGPVNVTITGTNFFVPPAPGGPTMSARLTHTTPSGTITGTNVTVISPTEMTCTFDVTDKGWGAASPWNVVVQQPSSGPSGTLNNAFAITNSGLTVTSITPNTGVNTSASPTVTIRGTGFLGTSGYFAGNPSVTMRKTGQTDRPIVNVYFTNSTQISGTLPVNGAALGTWDIIVTNWDGASATLTDGFTVYTTKPTLTSITPNSGTNDGPVNITNLAGTGFASGMTVMLTKTGEADIVGTGVTLTGTTKATCTFDLTGAALGPWNVVASNPGSQTSTLTNAFTVNHGVATALLLSPADQSVTVGGTATYTASAQDAAGDTWDVTAGTTFGIDVRAGGSWAGNVYTSQNVGDWAVGGTYNGLTGTATLHVTPGAAVALTLTPNPASVAAGGAVTYTATAEDAQGNTWDATADTAFSIDAGAGGTWAANVYTSQKVGDWTVTGDLGGITGTAALHVGPSDPISLVLTPDPGNVAAGGSVTYTATGWDAQGNSWDATADTTFGIDAGAGGSWATNVYTSAIGGTWTVTGTLGAATASAQLTVDSGGAALAVADITGARTQTVTLSATMTSAGVAVRGRSVSFKVAGVAAGSGVTNKSGVAKVSYLIPNSAVLGPNTITATYAGDASYPWCTGAGTLTVNMPPPTRITLTLLPASVISGGTTACQVIGSDGVDYSNLCTYSIEKQAGGSWAGNQYTAGIRGNWTIKASYSGLTSNATLTVTAGPAAAVTLTPTTSTIRYTKSQTYNVSARDAAGNTWIPSANCLSHNGLGRFIGYAYRPAQGDIGKTLTITATVAPAPPVTATLRVK